MTKVKLNFFRINVLTILFMATLVLPASAANVVQRGRVAASSNSAPGTRGAAARSNNVSTTPVTETKTDSEPQKKNTPIVVTDQSSQFTVNIDSSATAANNELSDAISRQRAALDAKSAIDNVSTKTSQMADGPNKCDTGLRKCMTEKCGADFAKCRTDTDTIWGTKIESCRTKVDCTPAEYNAFAPEIKADRDIATSMSIYDGILKCGENYDACITNQCGTTYSKCLGKANMDAAIAACKTTAQECIEYDSGLAARTGAVIATLRQGAEARITADEQRLYDLRKEMRNQCKMLGERVTLDERTMNCVFSVEFYANNDGEQTLFASKKAYAGSTFDCTPNWFGIDITTFKENAQRLTRSQTGASSAMLGAGVGTATGLITSGALNRAVETQKAQKAVKKAERQEKKEERKEKREEKKEERAEKRAERQANRADKKAARGKTDNDNSTPTKPEGGGNTDAAKKDVSAEIKKHELTHEDVLNEKDRFEAGSHGAARSNEEVINDAQIRKDLDILQKDQNDRLGSAMKDSINSGGIIKRNQ